MKELIKLLNEFEEEKAKYGNQYCNWQYIGGRPICTTSYDMNRIVQFSDLLIISKVYEFIKWLVDNDKIDNSKFYDKNILKGFMTLTKEEKADSIIMNLSISENPISDLISYLK